LGNARSTIAFLVKYDANGNVLWAKQPIENSIYSGAAAYSVTTDSTGSAYISGVFYDTIKFGSYLLKCGLIYKSGQLFLAKYDNNGNILWAEESSGGSINDVYTFTRLSSDSNNHIYMLFEADSVFVFGGKTFKIPKGSNPYLCTAIFNDSGKATCSSITVKSNNKGPNGFATDPSGKFIYTSGSVFDDTLIFGNDTLMYMHGSSQPYLARWQPCNSDDASIRNIVPNSANIILYPNPNDGLFELEISYAQPVSASQPILEVYNILGEKVLNETLRSTQGDNATNLSNQPNGIYLYRVIGNNEELIGEGKVIIQK
jgi:Secretion system C-terminal sorting domain